MVFRCLKDVGLNHASVLYILWPWAKFLNPLDLFPN